ncbi:protein of unknown function [Candidatus Methylomirabilis oxygeniifera]|uniref:Uncharacterized protein n=1 Tax=Methylomirabilis oxygeniifera TaxID=671143 RepID=D5MK18_METO1|nr:protein of unknown function [Candidatus Methylomirabilis oxyfera]
MATTWQARRDLNPQPSDLESDALPLELLASTRFEISRLEFRAATSVAPVMPNTQNPQQSTLLLYGRCACGTNDSIYSAQPYPVCSVYSSSLYNFASCTHRKPM